jgi:ribonuclease HI
MCECLPMKGSKPRFQLSLEAGANHIPSRWRFVLQAADGQQRIEAEDVEPDVQGDRLVLLTTVRALEALDQPSRVTILGGSSYLKQGVQFGIAEWRANDWQWECFGQMAPVKNADLWQRLEHLLDFHGLEFQQRRFDAPHRALPESHSRSSPLVGECIRLNSHVKPQPVKPEKTIPTALPAGDRSVVRQGPRLLQRSIHEWLLMVRRRLAYRLLGAG